MTEVGWFSRRRRMARSWLGERGRGGVGFEVGFVPGRVGTGRGAWAQVGARKLGNYAPRASRGELTSLGAFWHLTQGRVAGVGRPS